VRQHNEGMVESVTRILLEI